MNQRVLSSASRAPIMHPPCDCISPLGYEIMSIGETSATHDADELAKYVLPSRKELQMVFQFELTEVDALREANGTIRTLMYRPWKLPEFKAIVEKWQVYKRAEGWWNAYVFVSPFRKPIGRLLCGLECSSKITTSVVRSHVSGTIPPNGDRCRPSCLPSYKSLKVVPYSCTKARR